MLGRALDMSVSNIDPPQRITSNREAAFHRVWKVVHGANPEDLLYLKAINRLEGYSPNVPWVDYWQLEGIDGASDVILQSQNSGFIKLADKKDSNKNGILDGYDRTYHMHIADRPIYGVHQ